MIYWFISALTKFYSLFEIKVWKLNKILYIQYTYKWNPAPAYRKQTCLRWRDEYEQKRPGNTYFPPYGVSSATRAFTTEFGMESGRAHASVVTGSILYTQKLKTI